MFVCFFLSFFLSFFVFKFLKRLSAKGNISDRKGREVSEGGEGIYSTTLENIIRIYELYHWRVFERVHDKSLHLKMVMIDPDPLGKMSNIKRKIIWNISREQGITTLRIYQYWIFHHTKKETCFEMLKSSEHEKSWRCSYCKSPNF